MPKRARQYWLMKSEPDVYSISDLERDGATGWDSVRNYQARNFMRDPMKEGDLVLYYHSNASPPGVAGIARVSRESHADPTQFDRKSKYYDAKSTPESPRWMMVEVAHVETFKELVPLETLKENADSLDGMLVIKKGQRLSVQPVEKAHFRQVLKMGKAKTRVKA